MYLLGEDLFLEITLFFSGKILQLLHENLFSFRDNMFFREILMFTV